MAAEPALLRKPRIWHPVKRKLSASLFVFVAFWYAASFVAIIVNKTLVTPGTSVHVSPIILALVQTVSLCIGGLLQMSHGNTKLWEQKPSSKNIAFTVMILGTLRSLVMIFSLLSLRYAAASFTETVKASSPFFTVIAAFLLTGKRTAPSLLVTLIPVVLGIMITSSREASFTMIGFIAAISTNFTESIQNVQCSKLMSSGGNRPHFTPAQLQFYSAIASLLVQLPLFSIQSSNESWKMPFDGSAKQIGFLLISGILYSTQSALAFKVMSLSGAVTMSVLNTLKRAMIVFLSILYFGNATTPLCLLGTIMTLIGGMCYGLVSQSISKYSISPHSSARSEEKKCNECSFHCAQRLPASRRRGRALPLYVALLGGSIGLLSPSPSLTHKKPFLSRRIPFKDSHTAHLAKGPATRLCVGTILPGQKVPFHTLLGQRLRGPTSPVSSYTRSAEQGCVKRLSALVFGQGHS